MKCWREKRERVIVTLILFAMIGWTVEIFATAFGGQNVGLKDWHYWTLMGNTSILMAPTYIIGLGLIEWLNDQKWFYQLRMIWQTVIGGFVVSVVEGVSGIILIHILKLNPWNYENEFLNLWGIVCLKNYILFSLAIPLAIFLIDRIEWYLYRNEEDKELLVYSLFSIYKDLVTGK